MKKSQQEKDLITMAIGRNYVEFNERCQELINDGYNAMFPLQVNGESITQQYFKAAPFELDLEEERQFNPRPPRPNPMRQLSIVMAKAIIPFLQDLIKEEEEEERHEEKNIYLTILKTNPKDDNEEQVDRVYLTEWAAENLYLRLSEEDLKGGKSMFKYIFSRQNDLTESFDVFRTCYGNSLIAY